MSHIEITENSTAEYTLFFDFFLCLEPQRGRLFPFSGTEQLSMNLQSNVQHSSRRTAAEPVVSPSLEKRLTKTQNET